MSILIKGKMPSSCYDCKCYIEVWVPYCCLLMRYIVNKQERYDDCPLVEIPPHGRLIDADELLPIYADLMDGGDVKPVIPKAVIDTVPTIIESEE